MEENIKTEEYIKDPEETEAPDTEAVTESRTGSPAAAGCKENINEDKKEKKGGNKGFALTLIIVIILGIALNLCVGSVKVKETSMLPNFVEDDHLLINKVAYKMGKPERGDVIIFRKTVYGTSEYLIKRVIGLPGDVISITGGEVYINGKKQDQSYTKDGETPYTELVSYKVPAGKLYVMGDNRAVSLDSRSPEVGTVSISRVRGKAFFRLTPFSKFGLLPQYGGDGN